ncbi:MAG: type II toxin-antitoxin system RelE/ParE family toxin [Opitutae bacterium]|nr:type II toxin-antitoxin system RelE/ParE family toxin [Opitutae bacterium]
MSWAYEVTPEAARQLRDLGPSAAAEIKKFLDGRIKGAADPEQCGKPLRGELKGFWRYRVRDYRLLCRLEKSVLIVVVVAVGHRSSVYED